MTSSAAPTSTSALRRVAQGVVSLVVGALSLWFAFRGLGSVGGHDDGGSAVDELVRLLSSFPGWAIGAYVLSFLAQVFLRTERWRLQVRGLTGVVPTWRDALAINAIAFAAVFLLPFRLGEFVRPNLCAQRGIMSASAGLAATALERIIDGLVTTALFGVLLLLAPAHLPAEVRAGGLTALFVFGSAVVFLGVAVRMRAPTLAFVERAAGVVSDGLARKITHLVGGFLDGLACFRGARDVAHYVGLSIVYWLVNALSIHAVVVALVPGTSLFAAFLCMSFLVIGVMLPAPPGNVGNFHAFARVGLTAAGVAALPAVAIAVITHVLTVLCVVAWATVFLAIGGLRVRGAHLVDTSSAAPSPPTP